MAFVDPTYQLQRLEHFILEIRYSYRQLFILLHILTVLSLPAIPAAKREPPVKGITGPDGRSPNAGWWRITCANLDILNMPVILQCLTVNVILTGCQKPRLSSMLVSLGRHIIKELEL